MARTQSVPKICFFIFIIYVHFCLLKLNVRSIQVLFSPRCLAVLNYVVVLLVWRNHSEPCITNWIYHKLDNRLARYDFLTVAIPKPNFNQFFSFQFLTVHRNVLA